MATGEEDNCQRDDRRQEIRSENDLTAWMIKTRDNNSSWYQIERRIKVE